MSKFNIGNNLSNFGISALSQGEKALKSGKNTGSFLRRKITQGLNSPEVKKIITKSNKILSSYFSFSTENKKTKNMKFKNMKVKKEKSNRDLTTSNLSSQLFEKFTPIRNGIIIEQEYNF